jgi:hypothetical protein
MPKPPADRKHGTGDRNDDHVAGIDHHLQEHRDERKEEGAARAREDAEHDTGTDRD